MCTKLPLVDATSSGRFGVQDFWQKGLLRMEKDGQKMATRIFDLTLEIIYLLTGEDYIVVKKITDEDEAYSGDQVPITGPISHSLIHERNRYQEILDLTNKITELLTGEVPIRCQDVTVHLSMEEWEYLEGHKDRYKDVMMEDHQPLTSPDGSSEEETPERCPSPLYSKDSPEETQNIPQDPQVTHLGDIKVEDITEEEEETYAGVTQLCKEEEIPTDIGTAGDCLKSIVENLLFCPDNEVTYNNITGDNREEHSTTLPTTTMPSGLHSRDLSTDPTNHKEPSSDQPQIVKQNTREMGGKMFPCSECGKCFAKKSLLTEHQRIHTGEKPYSCSECGKCFAKKSRLIEHQRTHTEEKPFSCPECGKCFKHKSTAVNHQVIHSGEKPFSCLECGKCFSRKLSLNEHCVTHIGQRPFSCSECGKCFTRKSSLIEHLRIHTGEKPFSCPECGKWFSKKYHLIKHQRIHTGEKPFPCSECGKCFIRKFDLVKHQVVHTGERPFSCSECGKRYTQRSAVVQHKKRNHGNVQTVANDVPQV